jgi:hypothetical protein
MLSFFKGISAEKLHAKLHGVFSDSELVQPIPEERYLCLHLKTNPETKPFQLRNVRYTNSTFLL